MAVLPAGAAAWAAPGTSAVPAAPTAYILTRQLGGDGSLMAGIITGQTLVAVLSLPLVLRVFGSL